MRKHVGEGPFGRMPSIYIAANHSDTLLESCCHRAYVAANQSETVLENCCSRTSGLVDNRVSNTNREAMLNPNIFCPYGKMWAHEDTRYIRDVLVYSLFGYDFEQVIYIYDGQSWVKDGSCSSECSKQIFSRKLFTKTHK